MPDELIPLEEFGGESPELTFSGTTGRSAKNNNPLNLEYRPGSYQDKYGAELEPTGGGKDKSPRFAKFPTMEAGYMAGLDQIRLDQERDHTLASFVKKFAPSHENPTGQIIQQYAKAIGVSPSTPLREIAPEQLIVPMLARESSTRIGNINKSIKKAEKIGAGVGLVPLEDFMGGGATSQELVPLEEFTQTKPSTPAILDSTFAPTKEQAEATAKAAGVAVEPGLVEPTAFNPPMMVGGLAGIGRSAAGSLLGSLSRQGALGMLRGLPGMATGEIAAGATEDVLGKAPGYIKIPATMAADVLGGMGTDKLLRRLTTKAPIAPFTEYHAEEIGTATAKLDDVTRWMEQLKEGNWKAYNRLAELTGQGEKSASFARAATGLEAPTKALTPEALSEADMLNAWLKARRGRLDTLAGERGTLTEQIAKLKNKPLEAPVSEAPRTVGGGEVGAVAKSPLDLGPPIKDMDAQIAGGFSLETKPYMFDRIDRALPGAKDSIYWPHKLNEKTGLEEVQLLEAQSRQIEKALPRGSSEAIMLNAIARQKGGPRVLEAMGITEIPKLSPEQEGGLGRLRETFDELFTRFNQARVAAGKEPIDKVENYFTFFRRLDEAKQENLNILTQRKEFFNPRVEDLDFATKRVRSDLALVTDAFKVFRNYIRGVVPWIHQAPHLSEVAKLSKSLGATHPNLSYSLGRWVDNIQGIDMPLQLGALDKPLRKLTNNVSVATLGGYVRSALAQPASLVGSAGELGPRYLAQGIAESVVPSRVRFALENSKVLKTREFDVSIVDAMERMIGDTLAGRIKRGATAASYMPLRAMDAQAARATWLGAYKRGVNKGFDDPFKYADEVVLKTQGSAASSDIADIQTHALGKLATQFQTFVINDFKYIQKEIFGIKNPDITKREQLRKAINYVVAGALVNSLADEAGIPTPIPSPIKAMKGAREEDKEGLDVLKAGGAELLQKVPIVGGAARFGGSYAGPMVNFAERIGKGQETIPFAAAKLAGIPGVNQLQKLLPMIVGDEESNIENWKAALAGKTQERYEEERGTKDLSPEKRFMQGVREPVDSSLEELLQLLD